MDDRKNQMECFLEPSCGYTNCRYHDQKRLVVSEEHLKTAFKLLYSAHLLPSTLDHIMTDDGFRVRITNPRIYETYRILKAIPENDKLIFKMAAQDWVNSVRLRSDSDNGFSGHIEGIPELPAVQPGTERKGWGCRPNEYVYRKVNLPEYMGLLLLYKHVVIGKCVVHGHGN